MGALVIEPGGDLQTIYRVYPLKQLGDVTCLVGLNPADEMPGDVQGIQLFELDDRFLNEVLTEVP